MTRLEFLTSKIPFSFRPIKDLVITVPAPVVHVEAGKHRSESPPVYLISSDQDSGYYRNVPEGKAPVVNIEPQA
jgi:hypothetical protein